MSQIDEYLKQVLIRNGSDLHFIAGEPPRARIYGELQILAAILECTSRELLPERFRDIDRAAVQLRLSEIKLELKTL